MSSRSIIIPMFNECARIVPTLETIATFGHALDRTEIVVVDDGSSDGSPQIARDALARLGFDGRVIELDRNRGKGAAVRTGMLAATGDIRVFVDADLSVVPDDLERCIMALESNTADVAFGSRAHPDSALVRTQPSYRVASGRTFNLLLRLLGLSDDHDTQCGLKGCRAEVIDVVIEPLVTTGFAFDVEMLARAKRAGLRVMPTSVAWSHVDASRVRAVRDGAEMAWAVLKIRRLLDRERSRAGAQR